MPLIRDGNTVFVHGDYMYEPTRFSNIRSSVIDASDASWIVANTGSKTNLYPVSVYDSADVSLIGGNISGRVSLDLDWRDAYVNSAAVFVRDSDDVHVQDWRIDRAWDGIRFRGGRDDDFTVDNVWLSEIRDDAIENDQGMSGTIKDSLFDGVFLGISNADRNMANRSSENVTVDDVLIRMESYLYKGKDTHMSPFKVYDTSPGLKIYDTVIAIEDVNHRGRDSLERAWEKTTDASGNYLLNLSDERLPGNYPMPPKGFTVLQGEEARTYWDTARSDWIADHDGQAAPRQDLQPRDAAAQPPEPAREETQPEPSQGAIDRRNADGTTGDDVLYGGDANDVLAAKAGDDVLYGGAGNDILIGNEGDDVLRGEDGDDQLVGRLGADILIGGEGDDVFRVSKAAESSPADPDIVRTDSGDAAFEGAGNGGGDLLDLRGVDANSEIRGNQQFVFGSTKTGGLSLIDVDGDSHVCGNTDGDTDFEFVVVIEDGAISAAAYAASDFLI